MTPPKPMPVVAIPNASPRFLLNQFAIILLKLTGEQPDPINPIIPYKNNTCQTGGSTLDSAYKQIPKTVRPMTITFLAPLRSIIKPNSGIEIDAAILRMEMARDMVPRLEEKLFASGFT